MYIEKFLRYQLRYNKKSAFTLAEVLITLGIIGIVAAMIMPMLIQKYKEQETVAKVKKFYSVFSQAYTRAIMDNGTIDNWGLSDSVIEPDEDGNSYYTEASLEASNKFISILEPYLKSITYEEIKNQAKEGSKGFVLADGISIVGVYLKPSVCIDDNSNCGDFYITTDGKPLYSDKTSRTISKYCFAFILRKNRIDPVGDKYTFKTQCLTGKNNSRCTSWVILHGNMDYLHCSDLDYNGKTKCK